MVKQDIKGLISHKNCHSMSAVELLLLSKSATKWASISQISWYCLFKNPTNAFKAFLQNYRANNVSFIPKNNKMTDSM